MKPLQEKSFLDGVEQGVIDLGDVLDVLCDEYETNSEHLPGFKVFLDQLKSCEDFSSSAHLVVLEGLDGSGKSTVASLLKERLGERCVLAKTPPESISAFRAWFDRRDSKVRRAFYWMGNFLLCRDLKKTDCHFVVCDRFWASTVVYEMASSSKLSSHTYTWPLGFPKPKCVSMFFLDVSEEDRTNRMVSRDVITDEERNLAEKERFRDAVRSLYLKIDGILVIDASHHDASEVCKIIYDKIC